MIGALPGKMAAGHHWQRSPALLLLRSPPPVGLRETVVIGACPFTPAPQLCRTSPAVARPPPPAVEVFGLHPAGNPSSMEEPLPPPRPATTGVGLDATDFYPSMAELLPSPPSTAAGVGLPAAGLRSSMAVPLPPPPPASAGACLVAAGTRSSMAVPLAPRPPAAGVGLLTAVQYSRRSSALGRFLPGAPRVPEMVLPGSRPFTLSPSKDLPTAVARPAPPLRVGLLATELHSSKPMQLPPPRPHVQRHVVQDSQAAKFFKLTKSGGPGFERSAPALLLRSKPSSTKERNGQNISAESLDDRKACVLSKAKYVHGATLHGDMQKFKIPSHALWAGKGLFAKRPAHPLSIACPFRCYTKITQIPYNEVLSAPPPPPTGLMSALPIVQSTSPFAANVVAPNIYRAESFDIKVVLDVLEKDKDLVRDKFFDVDTLKVLFEESVREPLEARGLLWSYPLQDDSNTRCMHFYLHSTVGSLTYLSARRLMEILVGMPRKFWNSLLDFLSSQRTIVYLDWSTTDPTTSISFTLYDFGVKCQPDDVLWFKSESDASFRSYSKKRSKGKSGNGGNGVGGGEKENTGYEDKADEGGEEKENAGHEDKGEEGGEADIALIVWKELQLVWFEMYKALPSTSSEAAEGTGVYLQLKRTIGVDNLQLHTDNTTIWKVVDGSERIGPATKEYKLFELLRLMIGYYQRVVPRWVPRAGLTFVDGLMRNKKVLDNLNTAETASGEGERFMMEAVISSWSPHLRGDPFFKFHQGKGKRFGKFEANCELRYEDACYVSVEEEHKFDAMWHVVRALSPARVCVFTSSVRSSMDDFCNKLEERFGTSVKMDTSSVSWTTFDMLLTPRFREVTKMRDLTIVFDASLPKESYTREGAFTVFITSKKEKGNIDSTIPAFTPNSFVSFYHIKR